MYDDRPESINLRVLRLQAECPASHGAGTKLPTSALDRWKAVATACGSWHAGTEVDDIVRDQFSPFDPVQRDICIDLLRRYADLMSAQRDDLIVEDGDPMITVMHPNANAVVSAWYQFTLEGGQGPELIKIRTGLGGSTPDEVAVLIEGKDPEDSVTEVMLRRGTIETLDMDADERRSEIARIFSLWDETQSPSWPRNTPTPGLACYTLCPRPARCGQYPTPDGHRVSSNTRTIRLPKTVASWMRHCERHTAWRQVHQIPRDDGSEFDETRDLGSAFHDLFAGALLADDPDAAFEQLLSEVAASEVKPLRRLWDQHRILESKHEHPVEYLSTEYQIGVTVETTGLDAFQASDRAVPGKPVAIVFMARADATGRETMAPRQSSR